MPENTSRIATLEDVRNAVETKRIAVIDVLPPEHFLRRRLPGAKNACVYEVAFLDHIKTLGFNSGSPLLVYGAGPDSRDAATAAEKLGRAGFADVALFPGGLHAWKAAGLPLEGEEPDDFDPPYPLLQLERKAYFLLPDHSSIHWIGRNANGHHRGSVLPARGVLEMRGESLAGSVEVDMTTIRDIDLEGDELQPVLESHLRSDDFFFVRRFPRVSLNIEALQILPDAPATLPNATISGDLNMLGVSRPVTLQAHLSSLEGSKLALSAHFDLDRTEWGIVYGSTRFFQYLSYHVVFDLISIEARLVFA